MCLSNSLQNRRHAPVHKAADEFRDKTTAPNQLWQTNGVAERFNRTLKEQIIHGRIYRNIAELRDAVRDFVELYNAQWIVEKNGYLSPAQARQAWHAAISIRPAA